MENIINFSNQLQRLIEENKQLKDSLKRTEEWLKLAICENAHLQFRTTQNVDNETYQYFIDNTTIEGNKSGVQLIWNKQILVTFEGRTVIGLEIVKMVEIDEIFNGIKIDK